MTATVRAAASVLMLLGFYLVALGELAVVVALMLWFGHASAEVLTINLALPLITACVGVVGLGLWRALAPRRRRSPGLSVTPEQSPELWRTVQALATEARTRAPDEIRLVPEVDVTVTEQVKLLGLLGGRRTLYLGLPLLQILTVDRMVAVLAHELGHYSGRHSRLAGVAYRGRLAVAAMIRRIGPRNPVGWVFRPYAKVYLLVDKGASRRQELEADRFAVRVAGSVAAIEALRDLPVLDAAWTFFFRQYVQPGREHGYLPDDLFGGFVDFVSSRTDELDQLRDRAPDAVDSRWDTHPPMSERIAAMARLPTSHSGPVADAIALPPEGTAVPGTVLLADPSGMASALQDAGVAEGHQPLPWPEFTAATGTAVLQREADHLLREVGRTVSGSDVGLAEVLDLAAAGRLSEIAEGLFPGSSGAEATRRMTRSVESLLLLAAVHSGAARWRPSWSGPPKLTGPDGVPLPTEEIAPLVVRDRKVDEARKRLADLGIDAGAAVLGETSASAAGAGALAGLLNVVVDGERVDVVLLNTGLIIVPGLPRLQQRQVRPRMNSMLTSVPPEQLAAAAGHRFIPYEEFVAGRRTRRIPQTYDITLHGGQRLRIRAGGESEEFGQGWSALADALALVPAQL